jgi:hypothetical protein
LDTGTDSYKVLGPDDVPHFTAPATKDVPKLYVVSRSGILGYVGITSQSMATRLRSGLQASGKHGYHGYRWRNERGLDLDIWCLAGASSKRASDELECVEAEVVFLARQTFDRWPEFQTEIHFHQSTPFHRDAAARIIQHLKRNA